MSFAWPAALLALLLVPVAALAYVFAERRRAREADRFARAALLPNVVPQRPGRRRHVPTAVALLAFAARRRRCRTASRRPLAASGTRRP